MSIRTDETSRINNRIRELNKCMEVDTDMINSIKSQGDSAYVRAQIDKFNQKNDLRILEKEELELRLIKLESGEIDGELNLILENNRQDIINKNQIAKQKKQETNLKHSNNSIKSKKYYQISKESDKQHKYLNKDTFRAFSYWKRVNETVPDYILSNLNTMVNNKGYFWRGIAYFGSLPRDSDKITIFEKQKGNLLVIHEWDTNNYNIYHKKGRDKKFLYHSTPRKKHRIPRFV